MVPPPLAPTKHFWKGQALHWLMLVALLAAAVLCGRPAQQDDIRVAGISAEFWFAAALPIPVLHQVFVWLAWRSELCFGTITGWFGSKGFPLYRFVFFVLFVGRPVALIGLTLVDHDSISLPAWARVALCLLLGLPAAYTGYSVAKYFGMSRATGADHFDPAYRSMPMVTEGIFRYTSNSMYTFGFLALWVIAIAGASGSALVVAAFSHLYIWVHYYCTERPDMELIYGTETARG